MPGTLKRCEDIFDVFYVVRCYGCHQLVRLEVFTKAQAAKNLRSEQRDWSLGRDGHWRYSNCRPRRFRMGWRED